MGKSGKKEIGENKEILNKKDEKSGIFPKLQMRRAKQSRSDELSDRAQRMATERANKNAQDLNQKTDDSTLRSLEANREMLKERAMENSVLGRQGKADEQMQTPKKKFSNISPQVKAPKESPYDPNIETKKKTQVAPAHGGDSVPPGFKRAIQNDRVQVNSHMDHRVDPNVPRPQPSFKVKMHGIGHDPAGDMRKRRALEAKIREAASRLD